MTLAQATMIDPPVVSWLGIAPSWCWAWDGAGAAIEVNGSVAHRHRLGRRGGGDRRRPVVVLLHARIESGDGISTFLPFAGMIALDGFRVFARYVLVAVAGLGLLTEDGQAGTRRRRWWR